MSTLVLRQTKGTPLTIIEVDTNFSNLNAGKLETSGGTISGNLTVTGTISNTSITALKLPVGLTTDRPVTPLAGHMRYNSTLGGFEGHDGTIWSTLLDSSTAVTIAQGGTGVTTSTGSGANVLSTSPVLVTPALGTPTSGVLTSCTGLPLTTGITGTLAVANGGTGVTTSTGSGANVLSTTPTITGMKETKIVIAALNVDISLGNYFSKTITAISTMTVSNTPATGTVASFVIDLTNGGAFAVTWWAGMKWAAGTAPTLTASGRDVLGFFTHDGGTTWSGLVLAKDIK